jgi:hypothetical protein
MDYFSVKHFSTTATPKQEKKQDGQRYAARLAFVF